MSAEVLFKTYDGRVVIRNYLMDRAGKKLTPNQIAKGLESQGFEVDPQTIVAILKELKVEPESIGESGRRRYTWPEGAEIVIEVA